MDYEVARALRVSVEKLPEKLRSMKASGSYEHLARRLRDHAALRRVGIAPSRAWLWARVHAADDAAQDTAVDAEQAGQSAA